MNKKIIWHRIALHLDELSFNTQNLAETVAGHKKVCIARQGDRITAFSCYCPHAGAQLVNGSLDGAGNIVCPVHRYRFHTRNGYNTSGEGYYLKTYPTEERADGWYVGIADQSLFGE